MPRGLLAAALALLGGGCIAGDICLLPEGPPVWSALPSTGVYVGGSAQCGRRCEFEVGDVITAIDDVPVHEARDVYDTLADGRRHTVRRQRWQRSRPVRVRLSAEALRNYSLAPIASLRAVPEAGQGARLGRVIPTVPVRGVEQTRTIPNDFWGRNYIIFNFRFDHDPNREFLSPPSLEDLTVPLVVLAVGGTTIDDVNVRLNLVEGAGEVIFAQTERSFSTPWLRLREPDISVVDCHGVVRWSFGFSYSRIHYDHAMRQAIAFAAKLEQEREAGACWTPLRA